MLIHRYNLVFEEFHSGILEDVLELRNVDFVRENMFYNKKINLDQHVKWFENLDNSANFYFVISHNSKKIGVINIKDINLDFPNAELGIFFGDKDYLTTIYPFLAGITLIDIAVKLFKLKPFTKVMKHAKHVEEFNASLNFETFSETDDYFINKLNIDKHYHPDNKVRKMISVLMKSEPDCIQLLFKNDKRDVASRKVILEYYEKMSLEDKKLFKVI